MLLSRRTLLAAAPALALGSWTPRAEAAGGKLERVERGARGVTFAMALEHAPFPDGDSAHRDPTVLVFVPHHYRLPKHRRVDVVVHFHGHMSTAESAMSTHQLREQLYDSRQNAILVVPQGPVRAPDGHFGKLMRPRGLARMLAELLDELSTRRATRALGDASLAGARTAGMVCLSAHSGGYYATAACLRHGGVEVNEVYLFDALYGELDAFRRWVLAAKDARGRGRHKLVSHYVAGRVRDNNLALLAQLERAGVACLHETRPGQLSRAELTAGRAIFLATPLAHGRVTFEHNGLRDCLYASGLKRYLKSDWFEDKDGHRPIDRRQG